MKTRFLPVLAALLLPPAISSAGGDIREDRHDDSRRIRHIFLIAMENHATDEILGNITDAPFINELAGHSGVIGNYWGVTHPSLPNYLAWISGSFQGIWDDCKAGPTVTCPPEEFVPGSGDGTDGNYLTPQQIASASATPHWFGGKTIVDQLEAKHMSWKVYMQAMPAGGYDVEYSPIIGGQTVKLYAQKHNPFLYFSNIRTNTSRLGNIVPFESNFDADLGSSRVADFVWISPDQCHDMHGISPATATLVGLPACGFPDSGLDHGAIQLGDAFLRETVRKIVRSDAWSEGAAIVIAWDEDDYAGFTGCCGSPTGVNGITLGGAHAPAIVFTSNSFRNRTTWRYANHYTLLGTIQKLWNLGCLENTCGFKEEDLLLDMFDR
ncbi:MAG TPA: alkaline phosphatase family protein [Myxococcaceae bacterium]|nr:alkaline phosphatase family protein [Myxococcaceae bacterium]